MQHLGLQCQHLPKWASISLSLCFFLSHVNSHMPFFLCVYAMAPQSLLFMYVAVLPPQLSPLPLPWSPFRASPWAACPTHFLFPNSMSTAQAIFPPPPRSPAPVCFQNGLPVFQATPLFRSAVVDGALSLHLGVFNLGLRAWSHS